MYTYWGKCQSQTKPNLLPFSVTAYSGLVGDIWLHYNGWVPHYTQFQSSLQILPNSFLFNPQYTLYLDSFLFLSLSSSSHLLLSDSLYYQISQQAPVYLLKYTMHSIGLSRHKCVLYIPLYSPFSNWSIYLNLYSYHWTWILLVWLPCSQLKGLKKNNTRIPSLCM